MDRYDKWKSYGFTFDGAELFVRNETNEAYTSEINIVIRKDEKWYNEIEFLVYIGGELAYPLNDQLMWLNDELDRIEMKFINI